MMSKSSWLGSQTYGVALLTDLHRNWTNLNTSIAQAYTLSMSGYSNFMVDACGSAGEMDEDLCARWMQIAAFMPMLRGYHNRTYNDDKMQPQPA